MGAKQLSPLGRFEKILVATDGSEFSAGAERIAIAMCAKAQAQLYVMSAVISGGGSGFLAPEVDGRLEAEVNANLERVAALAGGAGIECTTLLCHGDDPYKIIVETSKDIQADMIVMGRRGRRGLARVMLGDATAKVMGYAPCSVLVVPKASQMWSNVLIATDGSRSSDAAGVTAARIAHCCETPVTVLSVQVPSHSERRQNEAYPIVERVVEYLKSEGVEATGMVEKGLTDDVIVKVAAARQAGLIVLGSHGRTGWGRVLFGSKSERVINQATCPVLVVKGA